MQLKSIISLFAHPGHSLRVANVGDGWCVAAELTVPNSNTACIANSSKAILVIIPLICAFCM